MAAIEIVLGDFATGVTRIRYTPTGRPFLRLTGRGGREEEVSLRMDVAGCAEHDEGQVSGYLARWMMQSGQSLDEAVRQCFRHERLFVVVLKDGRKFVARSTPDTVEELRRSVATARGAPRRREGPVATLEGRFSPSGLLNRWLSRSSAGG